MSFDDAEEELFTNMLQCCPCRVDDTIPMQGATAVEAEEEDDLFDEERKRTKVKQEIVLNLPEIRN